MNDSRSRWGARAAAIYDDAYAARYRDHDDQRTPGGPIEQLSQWIRDVCVRSGASIDVLDLGCGTGRYFQALANLRRYVGVDVSAPMLEQARSRVAVLGSVPGGVELIDADFLERDFGAAQFDLVCSIGVLAEHSPFDETIASRVRKWLKPGGRFAFSAVHPQSTTVPRTLKRSVAEQLMPLAPTPLRQLLRSRLMGDGLYADERRIQEVLDRVGMRVESIRRFQSESHLQLLTVAVSAAAESPRTSA